MHVFCWEMWMCNSICSSIVLDLDSGSERGGREACEVCSLDDSGLGMSLGWGFPATGLHGGASRQKLLDASK